MRSAESQQLLYSKLNTLLDIPELDSIEVAHYPLVEEPDNAHSPFLLYEERHLVVPHKALVFAYVAACKRFAAALPAEVMEATRIMILQNPDHLTALNTRRRHLLSAMSGRGLEDELRLTRLLLGIPSSSKSASLWHHRRWLLAKQHASDPHRTPLYSLDLPCDVLLDEIALATRACSLYPRNYAAYAYRSSLLHSASREILVGEHQTTARWLEQHFADHSAAQHFDVLAKRLGGPELRATQKQAREMVARYPTRETAWMLFRRVANLRDERDVELLLRHLLPNDDGVVDNEQIVAKKHATRAAAWLLAKAGRLALTRELAQEVLQVAEPSTETRQRLAVLLQS